MQPILIVFLLCASILDVALIFFAASRQDRRRSIYLEALTVVLFIYSMGYLQEIMSGTVEAVTTALRFENVAIPLIAPLFLLMVIALFHDDYLRKWMLPTALAYGIIMFIAILFNEQHHLYYTSVTMVYDGTSYYAALGRGPLYVVQQVISNLLMIVAYAILFRRFIRGNRKLRGQMMYILIGSLVGFVANILNFSGALPTGLDPMPVALTIGLIFISVNLFHYRLLDLVTLSSTLAVETMDDSMIVLGSDWDFVACNQSAKTLIPSLAQFIGTEQVMELPEWPKELSPSVGAKQVTFKRIIEGDRERTYRANISEIGGGRGKAVGWSLVIRDISDMVTLMHKLEEMATIDALTGIYNRRYFLDVVSKEMERAARHGIMMELVMYDLDLFKNINDTYGHAAGDHVLCSIVNTVKSQLRGYDVFARYGGEEFVIFSTYVSDEHLVALSERLCKAIAESEIVYEGERIHMTASFGAVQVPPGTRFDDAMRAADEALYRAKANGRNQVVVGIIE